MTFICAICPRRLEGVDVPLVQHESLGILWQHLWTIHWGHMKGLGLPEAAETCQDFVGPVLNIRMRRRSYGLGSS